MKKKRFKKNSNQEEHR